LWATRRITVVRQLYPNNINKGRQPMLNPGRDNAPAAVNGLSKSQDSRSSTHNASRNAEPLLRISSDWVYDPDSSVPWSPATFGVSVFFSLVTACFQQLYSSSLLLLHSFTLPSESVYGSALHYFSFILTLENISLKADFFYGFPYLPYTSY
jgi:hypothetical protein